MQINSSMALGFKQLLPSPEEFCVYSNLKWPIPVAVRSIAWVCGRSFSGTVGSNTAEGMDICCDSCVLSGRGLCVGLITRPEESLSVIINSR